MLPQEAEEALGEKADQVRADVPADAASLPSTPSPNIIKIGNREFAATPQMLGDKKLDILPDLPDIRDRIYQPHLKALRSSNYPKIAFSVRDQGALSSCTGHALAHVIDYLLYQEALAESPRRVSARMLYEMAKRNDEWTGTTYNGSSARGAVSGFYRNGVCSEALEPEDKISEWILTYEMAKEARETRLGTYYRLQADLSDYHAALEEIGVIYASAQIHKNWEKPVNGKIEPGGATAGGHAFAIVGYDADGFWVLNSWGPGWGNGGLAHWRYEDWASTMMDGWVLQLGVRAPTAFSAIPLAVPASTTLPQISAAPNRSDIVGHFINIDDGRYVTGGRYASPTEAEMKETVKRLSDPNSNKDPQTGEARGYDHLVIYAHGGLNTLNDEANRIATWKRNNIWSRNRIYNFHLMWGSGFIDEAFGTLSETQAGRASGLLGDLLFETGFGKTLGSAAWRNMKQDAAAAFTKNGEYDGGFLGLSRLLGGLDKADRRPLLHLVGHSAGSIVLGRLLGALQRFKLKSIELGTIHLMAPACTTDFFKEFYEPYLKGKGALPLKDKLYLYNLNKDFELSDTVGIGGLPGYGRSLLHLVSRAYEDDPNTRLAGMQIYNEDLPKSDLMSVEYSLSAATKSTSHGGFDNDVATLSTIMSRLLGHPAPNPPSKIELSGY
ncbi:C1 family peptidase [Mesorhizobium mediterraneum]|uniref:C1 family peptidase n=1 Tax=Mesorhizobium mediterraneum TaxID=43617 RepID=UPI001AED4E77|nr:C1 family peptidase [Mesorhizobium mediterraneum]